MSAYYRGKKKGTERLTTSTLAMITVHKWMRRSQTQAVTKTHTLKQSVYHNCLPGVTRQ